MRREFGRVRLRTGSTPCRAGGKSPHSADHLTITSNGTAFYTLITKSARRVRYNIEVNIMIRSNLLLSTAVLLASVTLASAQDHSSRDQQREHQQSRRADHDGAADSRSAESQSRGQGGK